MKFLTNTFDPGHPDSFRMVICQSDQTQEEAYQSWKNWLSDKHIGPPQATQHISVTELMRLNIVGVYQKEG